MKRHISIVLFFSLGFSFAQISPRDSLKSELKKASSDTAKISILIEIAYKLSNVDSALIFLKEAHALGQETSSIKHKSRSEIAFGQFLSERNLDSGIALINSGIGRYVENEMHANASNAYYIKGIIYNNERMLDSAIASYKSAFELGSEKNINPEWGESAYALSAIFNKLGKHVEALKWSLEAKEAFKTDGLHSLLSETLNQIGIIYDQKGLYAEALENYLGALDLAKQVADVEGEIYISNNIGVIYDNMNNTELSMQYYSDALEKSRIHNLPYNEAMLLNNLSYIYLSQEDTLKAISLLQASLKIDLSSDYPCFESYPLEGMGAIYLAQRMIDSADYYLQKALAISKECQDKPVIATVYKDLGQLFLAKREFQAAKEALTTSLEISKETNFILEENEAHYELYQFYKRIGDGKSALYHLESYQSLSDSLATENNVEKATKLAAEYEFRKQVVQMEKDRRDAEDMLSDQLKAKTNENKLILLVLGLILLFSIIILRGYFLIQRNNKRLKTINDDKNKLIGIVAHDLRNPLNMIMGLMPLIHDSISNYKDSNLTKYVAFLDDSTVKMNNMIDRVLDISAIENMKVNLKPARTDLTDLVVKSIGNFDLIASKKEIKIVNEVDRESAHFSTVDPNYLEQVIDNLLSNAIKFSENGTRIFVSLVTEGEKNQIEVRDEGPGISDAEKENLFTAFTTLSSKPTGNERSTGLGLSIAHKFIAAMKGEIICESQLGKGTSFKIVFDQA